MTRSALFLLVFLGVGGSAASQPAAFRLGDQLPDGTDGPILLIPTPLANVEPQPIGPRGAVLLSVGATAGTVGLGYLLDQRSNDGGTGAIVILTGLLMGPSVGNLVVGNYRGALIGGGLRVAGATLTIGGVAASFMNDSAGTPQAVAIVSGLVLGAAGVGYDVGSAGVYASRVRLSPSVDGRTGTPLAILRVEL